MARRMWQVCLIVAGIGLGAAQPPEALAQARVHGTVRDSAGATPLSLVDVLVDGTRLSARTDAAGRYSLDLPLGAQLIRFRRAGYHPAERALTLTTANLVRLDLALQSQAVQLDSVRVDAPAPPRSWPPGMADRIKAGFGHFVTDSTLRRFEHTNLAMAVEFNVTGVRFKRVNGRNVAISARGPRMKEAAGGRMGAADCHMSIWLDGLLLSVPSQGPVDFDRFAVVSIEAVEVFTPAQVPAQYRGGSAGCGVILLWTRTQRR